MIRILRYAIAWLLWVPWKRSLRIRVVAAGFAGAVLLTVGSPGYATIPPPPQVSDRMSALPSTGLTRAAVATPSAQASPNMYSPGSASAADTLVGVPSTPICGGTWNFLTGTYEPYARPNPIYLREGAVIEQAVDLRVPGPICDWGQTRSYSSRVLGSESLGGKWLTGNVDYQLIQEGMYDVSVIVDATSKRLFTYTGAPPSGTYSSAGDATISLVHDTSNSLLTVTDWTNGAVNIFEDFYMYSTHPGKLQESTTLAWQEAGKDGMLYTYNGSHQVIQITTGEGQDYNIAFSYTGNKISTIEVRTGADTSTRVRQVEYTYCDSQTHSADVGDDGDLVQVAISQLKTGGSVGTAADWTVRSTQYRYDDQGLLKAVFEPDAVQSLIDDRSDIDDAEDILTKGDDDDDSGAEDHKIAEYASRRFTYYTTDVKTDNSGAGTAQDPKCVTVWAPTGENLQSTYGGTDADEVDAGEDKYLVKSETIGACAGCGTGSGSVTREYFYMEIDHGDPDPNEVVWLVVEDTIDADDNGVDRRVCGLSDSGRRLREVTITDPTGSPDVLLPVLETGDRHRRQTEPAGGTTYSGRSQRDVIHRGRVPQPLA